MAVPGAPVKRTSDHCKAAEFPMKACWKEDAQAVANEPQNETVIEAVHAKSAFSD
jgi:hypothetical protein